jgi:uncharacterized protein YhbP (UPF0306 family)
MDKEIVDFINESKVATVCCTEDEKPYCFNCYYAFIEQECLLIYKSSYNTRHEKILESNQSVAGTIIPEQIDLTTLKGIQFEGTLLKESFDIAMKAAAVYYLRFPFAMAVPGKVYIIELKRIKLTDNSRGFGYKQHWER